MAILVEGRKLLFTAETQEENKMWFLRLLCKNAELTYLRKMQVTNSLPNSTILQFLRNPLVFDLRFDPSNCPPPSGFGIEDTVALTTPLRCHELMAHVSLDFVSLANISAQTICTALKNSPSIKSLSMQGNNLSAQCATDIADFIANNRSIEELILSHNQFSDRGVEIICQGVSRGVNQLSIASRKVGIIPPPHNLKLIVLDHNGLGPQSGRFFFEAFQTIDSMPELSLHNNQLGDEGIKHLIGLIFRPGFPRLLLDNNNVGDDGCLALASALDSRPHPHLSELYLQDNTFSALPLRTLSVTIIVCFLPSLSFFLCCCCRCC